MKYQLLYQPSLIEGQNFKNCHKSEYSLFILKEVNRLIVYVYLFR